MYLMYVHDTLPAEMPCSYCRGTDHNIRTCKRYNAEKVAQMIAENAGKNAVYAMIDMTCPGAGSALALIDKAFSWYGAAGQMSSKTKNERFRGVFAILVDGQ